MTADHRCPTTNEAGYLVWCPSCLRERMVNQDLELKTLTTLPVIHYGKRKAPGTPICQVCGGMFLIGDRAFGARKRGPILHLDCVLVLARQAVVTEQDVEKAIDDEYRRVREQLLADIEGADEPIQKDA